MIRYTSPSQLSLEGFSTPFEANLDPNNRWIKLSKEIPWDDLVSVYYHKLSKTKGAGTTDARIVIGALMVKHYLKLSDIDTIECIKENIYIQYFLGLPAYTYKAVFDPSLFVQIRKRLGVAEFEKMTVFLMKKESDNQSKPDADIDPKEKEKEKEKEKKETKELIKRDDTGNITHKGTIKIDATVTDAEIKYPTDLDILNSAREKCECLIDKLSKKLGIPSPRTYRQNARRDYLSQIKKKSKSKKQHRKGLRQQHGYLRRNIATLDLLLDMDPTLLGKLSKVERKYFWVIRLVYDQQKQMYDEKKKSCSDRIVSIHQPHVRPIVRGKSKHQVEFGAKIGVCIDKGYDKIDKLSWNAYNESADLPVHLENYKKQHGYYPYRVLGDKIYLNRANRTLMKELGIEAVGAPLGRPSKESQTAEHKAAMCKAAGERNEVEAVFGVAKRRYAMNNIRARLAYTAESWIAAGFFVFNLQRFLKGLLFVLKLIILTLELGTEKVFCKTIKEMLSKNKTTKREKGILAWMS